MSYDLFISYARKDNAEGRITELKERIEADYLAFTGTELRCFFDINDIKGMHDWRHRILAGLRHSHLFLLVLSPNYLDSPYCDWEIVEYLKYEHSRAAQGQGVAPIYFVEVPGLDTPGFMEQAAAWLANVRRRQGFDLRPWYDEGISALTRQDVRTRLGDLKQALRDRLSRLRRLESAPGNLPAANSHFVGRLAELERLHRSAGLGKFGVLTALQGMGGLGKTALAIQYACAYADFYPGGRWLIGCAGATSLPAILRRLDVDLGVTFTEDEQKDDERAARRILAELESRAIQGAAARAGEQEPPKPQALLLLDNLESPALLQPPQADLLTGKRWLRVLATTRLGADDFGYDPLAARDDRPEGAGLHDLLAVDELPPDDALSLIESYQTQGHFPSEAERRAVVEIVTLLQGFTLAVEVVAVYLGERAGRITCAAFLERLRHEGLEGLEMTANGTKGGIPHVEKLVSATLTPTLKLLRPEEILVMNYAALLPPDNLPLPWLRALAAQAYPQLGQEAAPGYDDPWLSLLNHLIGLRLLQLVDFEPDGRTPRLVRIHRLVQEVVRAGMTVSQMKECQESILVIVRQREAALEETVRWTEVRWEVEPLDALAVLWAEKKHPEAAWLFNQVGLCWYHLAEWTRAEPLMRRALDINENNFGPDHPEVAISLNNLAGLLLATNHLGEAEPLMRRALAIDETSFGPGHPNVAIRLNNLASLLQDTNRMGEAEPLMRRALAIDENSFGPDHPNVASDLNNLAQLFQDTNRLGEAEPLMRRALAVDEASLGPDHPKVAIRLNNLALLLKNTSRLGEAESLMRRALAIDEKSFGPDHSNVARELNNLALLLQDTNRLTEAEPHMRRALDIDENSFGPDHPTVARDLNNLASLLQDTNRLGEAESLMRRALGIDENSFGPDHPNVARDLNNLAGLLQNTNCLTEAEPLMRRNLDILFNFSRATGHRHPNLQVGVNNYANLLNMMGFSEADILARLRELAPDFFSKEMEVKQHDSISFQGKGKSVFLGKDEVRSSLENTFPAKKDNTPCSNLPQTIVDENVQFTVYRPKVVAPEKWYPLLAFAHLADRAPDAPQEELDPIEKVKEQARQILADTYQDYQPLVQDSTQGIPREGEITFLPEIPGCEFNPPRRTFLWLESVHREEFRMRASKECDGRTLRGRLSVFLGCILVAEVPLSVKVSRHEKTKAPGTDLESTGAKPYRKIFASYSRKDISIVNEFESYITGLGLGDRYMRDLVELRAGEEWNPRLMEMIREANIFQLFWSSNSMRSSFVEQEWQFALSLQRPYFVRPTYWEEPFPELPKKNLPPEELRRLHFVRVFPQAGQVTSTIQSGEIMEEPPITKKSTRPNKRTILDKRNQSMHYNLVNPWPLLGIFLIVTILVTILFLYRYFFG